MLFMRYFHITSTIKKSYEFSKSKNTYLPILKECSAGVAMQKAEELSESLRVRYEKRAKVIGWENLRKIFDIYDHNNNICVEMDEIFE